MMFTAKLIEVRDTGTFIPCLALKVEDDGTNASYLLRRAGYTGGGHGVLLFNLVTGVGHSNPWSWGTATRTMIAAHASLCAQAGRLSEMKPGRAKHFDRCVNGEVVDVAYMIGLRDRPVKSEQEEVAL